MGLRAGDIVREMNSKIIEEATDLEDIMDENAGRGSVWSVTIERNGRRISSNVRI